MPHAELPRLLRKRMQSPLPGRDAQRKYEPSLSFGRHFAAAPPSARPAAVLALLYPDDTGWHMPFTLRPPTMADHAGQISFPGGAIEAGESSDQAALRELEEELGIPDEGIQVLGQLSPLYLFVTHFAVSPWLAVMDHRPQIMPCEREVAEVLEVPVTSLLEPRDPVAHQRQHRALSFRVPHFQWHHHRIWGATAMMLSELVEAIREVIEEAEK